MSSWIDGPRDLLQRRRLLLNMLLRRSRGQKDLSFLSRKNWLWTPALQVSFLNRLFLWERQIILSWLSWLSLSDTLASLFTKKSNESFFRALNFCINSSVERVCSSPKVSPRNWSSLPADILLDEDVTKRLISSRARLFPNFSVNALVRSLLYCLPPVSFSFSAYSTKSSNPNSFAFAVFQILLSYWIKKNRKIEWNISHALSARLPVPSSRNLLLFAQLLDWAPGLRGACICH